MNKKYYVTWAEFHRDVQALVWNLPDLKWEGIIAVTRGGLVPAALLARALDIKMIETLCISSYDDTTDTQTEATVLKPLALPNQGENWLVVDDLVDTGVTFQIARRLLPKAHLASVYAKKVGKESVDTYVSEVNAWIVFPWEEEAPERLFSLS